MASFAGQVARQLTVELASAVARWAPIVGPDLALTLQQVTAARTPILAGQLCADDDDLAAETVRDVLGVLWPADDPDPEWWRTPLGRVCARSLGRHDSEAVTHAVAAAMLGVARGTVATLVQRGTLDRHPDGGVTRASVYARLWRLADS